MLHLNQKAQKELSKIDQIDFDIFKLRDATGGNELVTVMSYLVPHCGLMINNAVDVEKLINYMVAV